MRSIFRICLFALCLGVLAPVTSSFAQGAQCAQPVSTGEGPTASDCLFILRIAVGIASCPSADCFCDSDGSGSTTATDALVCLRRAVGDTSVPLVCCGGTTTTSTSSTTLFVGTSTTTTTTLPVDGFDPMVRLTGGGCVETLSANGMMWTVPGVAVGEQSDYQLYPGEFIGPFTWSSDACGGDPVVERAIPTVWRLGRADGCRYALNALNGASGVVSVLSEFGSPECRPTLEQQ